MIRHQMTGAGLHTLSFRGPEAKSRYLPTLRRSLQAVKTHAELMPSCQGLRRNDLHFSKPLFTFIFCK